MALATDYHIPMSEEEQEKALKELKDARKQLVLSSRKVQNLEKANQFLVVMNENAETIRDLHEKEIMANKQKAEEASKAKSTFLAQMSHEMRTPMNAIKVLSELLLRTELDKVQKDYARNIVNASATLLNIINDVLDFSKLDANKFEIVNAPYDFSSLISDVSNIVNLKAVDKDISFFTEIDPAVPCMLNGDDLRLKQILLNLLQNAVKFTEKGYVKLEVKTEKSVDPSVVYLNCAVVDTGIGLREESLQRLFEPFMQADVVMNHKQEGTGLGLSITKRLLKLMGGEIEVQSTYEKGSTFRFRVPQHVIDYTPIGSVQNPEEKRVLLLGGTEKAKVCANMFESLSVDFEIAADERAFLRMLESSHYTHLFYFFDAFGNIVKEHESKLKNCKQIAVKDIRYAGIQRTHPSASVLFEPILIYEIAKVLNTDQDFAGLEFRSDADEIGKFTVKDAAVLIVDDNDVNLMVMDQLLKQYRIEAMLAESGYNALNLCKNQKFDIIFMDHMMPGMDGVETTKNLRDASNPNYKTPVIVVTANALVGMREEFLKQGMDDYISKPIDIKELNYILKSWLPLDKIIETKQPFVPDGDESPHSVFVQDLVSLGIQSLDIISEMGYSLDTYTAILETFVSSVPDTMESLQQCLKQQDYDAFRIHVHGVKGALANIGAGPLSEVALSLEYAAKEGKYTFIQEHFKVFYEEVLQMINNISLMAPKEDMLQPASQSDMENETIVQMLKDTVACLDALDSINALEILNSLAGGLGHGQQKQWLAAIQQIKVNIENFEYDLAMEQLEELVGNF